MKKISKIAGVDEAGRGPLAGPVFAAAVILDPDRPIAGLADSKKLSPDRRLFLADQIKNHALAWEISRAEVFEIDQINILQATLLAMKRAIEQLAVLPDEVWVDGRQVPLSPYPIQAIVKGDQTVPAISAASILAKTARDHEMTRLDQEFPGYGFAQHKGYPTQQHLKALAALGVTPIHRTSYQPVRRWLEL